MTQQIHIMQLTQLGLNVYEAKAYLALLGKDSFTAPQVADVSGVPRQRIYDILASLVERGMAISRPGRQGTKYAAVAPTTALPTLLEREQHRLRELQVLTEDLVATLGSHYQEGRDEHSPLEYIEVLRGRTAINRRFAEIQASCQRELLIFTKPPYATSPQDNTDGLKVLQRGVKACSLYEYSVLTSTDTRTAIEHFMAHGEQARFVEHLPMKLVVVDGEIVMMAMEDPIAGRTDLTIMVIEQRQLAQIMKLAFNALWDGGDTFDTALQRLGLPRASTAAAPR